MFSSVVYTVDELSVCYLLDASINVMEKIIVT